MATIYIHTIFFQAHDEVQHYAFANRLRTGLDFFNNSNLYLRNVLGFVGKHLILQITPEEEIWTAKIQTMGHPLKFLFPLHFLVHVFCFLSTTARFCFVCTRYGYFFKSTTITLLPVDMLKFKDWLRS